MDGGRRHAVVHRVLRPAAVPARRGQRHPGRRDAGARRPRRASGTPTCGSTATACSPSGRPTRRGRGAAERRQRDRAGAPPTAAPRCWSRGPDFVSDPRPAPDGVTLVLAAVGPPGHALGRRPAGGPRGRRHRARARRRRPASRSCSRSGARTWRCGGFSDRTDFWSLYRRRPHERGRAGARRRQRHRRPAVGVRAEPLRAARRRPGGASPTAGTAPTGSPSSTPDGERARARPAVRVVPAACAAQGDAVVCVAGGPAPRAGGAAGRRRRRRAPRCSRPARDLGLDPAWFSRPEHVDLPDRGRGTGDRRRPRAGLPADQPRGQRPATASCRRCWCVVHGGPTVGRRSGAGPRRPVLDVARLLRRRRRLPRLDRLRPPLPRRAAGPLGHRSTSTTSSPARATWPSSGRVDPARHGDPRRLGRRLHDAGGPDLAAGRVHRRRQPLRRRRPRRAGRRHPQVRVPLPRRAGRAVARRAPTSTPSAHRSTTSTRSTPRSRCSRATRTRSCRRSRPR